jgi:hypothetical protein
VKLLGFIWWSLTRISGKRSFRRFGIFHVSGEGVEVLWMGKNDGMIPPQQQHVCCGEGGICCVC